MTAAAVAAAVAAAGDSDEQEADGDNDLSENMDIMADDAKLGDKGSMRSGV